MNKLGNNSGFGSTSDTRTLTLKVKADVDNARDGLDRLNKKLDELGKNLQKQFKSAGEMAERFNALGEAGKRVVEVFQQSLELAHFSAEMKNLEKNIPVKTLEMMQVATEGAVKKLDLMKFGMRALHGELRLTEAGLNTVLKAANTLSDQGFGETQAIAERLLDSLRKGSSKELKEFAIGLKDTDDKGQNVNKMLAKFRDLADMEVNVDPQLKKIERLQTSFGNLMDSMKRSAGDALNYIGNATATTTTIMAKMQDAMIGRDRELEALQAKYGRILDAADKATGRTQGGLWEAFRSGDRAKLAGWNDNASIGDLLTMSSKGKGPPLTLVQRAAQAGLSVSDFMEKSGPKGPLMEGKHEAAGGHPRSSDVADLSSILGRAGGDIRYSLGLRFGDEDTVSGPLSFLDLSPDALSGLKHERDVATQQARTLALASAQQTGSSIIGAAGQSILGAFGQAKDQNYSPEFAAMAERKEALSKLGGRLQGGLTDEKGDFNAAGTGFKLLQDATTAAVTAAIEGNGKILQAVKKAVAGTLKALAIEATTRALFNSAMGVGALFLDPPAAAGYFKSAAMFGIAAVAAGAGAAALGGGGEGASGSASGGSGYSSASNFSTGGGSGGGGSGGSPSAYNASITSAGALVHSSAQGNYAPNSPINITFTGNMIGSNQKELGQMAARAIDAARAANYANVRPPGSSPSLFE